MRAIDTVTDITAQTALALKQKGVGAVFGYLGPWSKCLTVERVKILKDAGLLIGTLFEGDGKTFSAAQGKRDALMAKQHAESIGQPYGTGICTCVDYDAQPSDYPAIQAYIRAWRSVMDGYYRTGLYAPYDVLKAMRGEVSFLIEPSAWSNGQRLPGIAAYQNSVSTTLCGIGVDIDEVYDTSILWGGSSVEYPKVLAQVDGKDVLAVAVGNTTYLNWTVARDSGCNITKVAVGDVEIKGNKPPQVSDTVTTYIKWSSIPTIDANPKHVNGVWQFSTKHTYTMTVTETQSAVVGEWATIEVQTLDNGKPFAKQIITIDENSTEAAHDYTDDTGRYVYRIIETSGKTDSVTVSWTDPAGKTHTTTHSTVFTAPTPSPTPIPSDDKIVAQFPLLPTSDAMDAVYFNMTAPNGQTIQCQLDTGAFELMFTSAASATLGLKNEQSITIGGVGGTTPAYDSHATFRIGGVEFSNVPCTVAPSFTGYPLFGYKFFVDNGYDLLVSQKHNTVTILKSN